MRVFLLATFLLLILLIKRVFSLSSWLRILCEYSYSLPSCFLFHWLCECSRYPLAFPFHWLCEWSRYPLALLFHWLCEWSRYPLILLLYWLSECLRSRYPFDLLFHWLCECSRFLLDFLISASVLALASIWVSPFRRVDKYFTSYFHVFVLGGQVPITSYFHVYVLPCNCLY